MKRKPDTRDRTSAFARRARQKTCLSVNWHYSCRAVVTIANWLSRKSPYRTGASRRTCESECDGQRRASLTFPVHCSRHYFRCWNNLSPRVAPTNFCHLIDPSSILPEIFTCIKIRNRRTRRRTTRCGTRMFLNVVLNRIFMNGLNLESNGTREARNR